MKYLVIEDEQLAAERLITLVNELVPEAILVGKADSVKSAVRWLQSHTAPDLIFMDIQLADGLSFKIFELCKVEAPVIFTTAYNEYAIRAFKVNSVDYLLKPIDINDLKESIDKYFRLFQKPEDRVTLDDSTMQKILKMFSNPFKARFVIKVGEHLRHIGIEDVAFFHAMEKETFLTTIAGKSYGLEYSLDQLEELTDPKIFFRINRKFLISLKAIKDIISYSGSRLKIKVGEKEYEDMIVSREKVSDFKNWLEGDKS
ncbi:MAG: response regulator transcription factor [Bacteroidetes bacterium]|nr:response regulator transcription factor [Bacteroidales bacterium]NJO69744.1 response regulator transcription factor [Bacteroidota bacterium]